MQNRTACQVTNYMATFIHEVPCYTKMQTGYNVLISGKLQVCNPLVVEVLDIVDSLVLVTEKYEDTTTTTKNNDDDDDDDTKEKC